MKKPTASHTRLVANLKRLRGERNLTQAQLADRAGLNRVYVTLLEGGNRKNPSLEALDQLADALGVSVIDLLR